MDAQERAAVARGAAEIVRDVNTTVESVSSVIRDRVRQGLAVLGPAGRIPMDAVDATHRGAHSAIGGIATIAGTGGSEILARTTDPEAPSLVASPERRAMVAGLGAAFGDRLADAFAPAMSAHPDPRVPPRDSLAVLIHGLGGHEAQWGPDYAPALARAGFSPIFVRYTTGRAIDDNARELIELLDELVDGWPVPVSRIVLVTHSMGGLVATHAVHQAADARWPDLVTDVVTLGTPHKGAPLERFADRTLRLIQRSSVTAAPIVELGHRRSQGIKDLATGVDEPLPAHIHHHAVVAHRGKTPTSPLSLLLGDGIVPGSSAAGHAPHSESVEVTHITETGHLSLLDHPEVTAILLRLGRHHQPDPAADSRTSVAPVRAADTPPSGPSGY